VIFNMRWIGIRVTSGGGGVVALCGWWWDVRNKHL